MKSIYGDNDQFLNQERLETEKAKLNMLFQGNFELIKFAGEHKIVPQIITDLV